MALPAWLHRRTEAHFIRSNRRDPPDRLLLPMTGPARRLRVCRSAFRISGCCRNPLGMDVMHKPPRPLLGLFSLLACLLPGPDAFAQAPKKDAKLADYFGFLPLELYKHEHRIGNL